MALVDSEAAFTEHCTSVGAPYNVVRALKNLNITTFAGLAFACGKPQNPPSDETFREFANTLCLLHSLLLGRWLHLGGFNLKLLLSW